jgi:hypothetical protein
MANIKPAIFRKRTYICTLRITWSFHSGGYEKFYLLGYNAVQSGESQRKLRRNMWPPSSGSEQETSIKQVSLFPTCFMLVSCLAYSSTLKREARTYSEPQVDFYQATRRYIPEEMAVHTHNGIYKYRYLTMVFWDVTPSNLVVQASCR